MPQHKSNVEETVKQQKEKSKENINKKNTKDIKKKWHLRPVRGGDVFTFFPTFLVNPENDFIETRWVDIGIKDKTYRFNFLDLYMFIYFCSNEELRQSLAHRYERKIEYVPYEVTFKLSEDEKKAGMAKRRIELPIDELAVYMAKQKAGRWIGWDKLRHLLGRKTK